MKAKLTYLIPFLLLTLFSCQKDECATVDCLNGGYCANGECVCPEGFQGADCSQQETPSAIKINSIEVTRFPATDDGAGWDLTSGCDIYPIIEKGSTEIWKSSEFYQNADPDNDFTFNISPAAELNDPNDQYSISLYDFDDFDPDDFMGGINFTPYSSNNGFPTTINLDAGGDVAFTISVSYEY
jgi:hypothetical protein